MRPATFRADAWSCIVGDMNMFRLLALGFAALPLVASADNSYVYGNVSSWTVRTDPGHAYRCFAEVQYEGGTSIRIGYNTDQADLYLRISDPTWRWILPGAEHRAKVEFENASSFALPGDGIDMTLSGASGGIRMIIPKPSRQSFLQDFMARDTLTVSIDGSNTLDLSLAGSTRATRMLDECQTAMARHAASVLP